MDESKALASSRLFSGLDDAGLEAFRSITEARSFAAGDAIFQQGEPGRDFYLIVDGEVRISLAVAGGGEEALAILGPGNAFGETSLMAPGAAPRSATAIAHRDCEVLVFGKLEVLELLGAHHDMAFVVFRNLLEELSSHLRAANERLILLSASGRF